MRRFFCDQLLNGNCISIKTMQDASDAIETFYYNFYAEAVSMELISLAEIFFVVFPRRRGASKAIIATCVAHQGCSALRGGRCHGTRFNLFWKPGDLIVAVHCLVPLGAIRCDSSALTRRSI
jgi:hypothetical protein